MVDIAALVPVCIPHWSHPALSQLEFRAVQLNPCYMEKWCFSFESGCVLMCLRVGQTDCCFAGVEVSQAGDAQHQASQVHVEPHAHNSFEASKMSMECRQMKQMPDLISYLINKD